MICIYIIICVYIIHIVYYVILCRYKGCIRVISERNTPSSLVHRASLFLYELRTYIRRYILTYNIFCIASTQYHRHSDCCYYFCYENAIVWMNRFLIVHHMTYLYIYTYIYDPLIEKTRWNVWKPIHLISLFL